MKQTGIVKWFNDAKGFGFIACDDRAVGDCFVHYSDITGGASRRSLQNGTPVEFAVETTERGLRAREVAVLPANC